MCVSVSAVRSVRKLSLAVEVGMACVTRACKPALSGASKRWIIVSNGNPSRLCISSTERKRSSSTSSSVTNPNDVPRPPRHGQQDRQTQLRRDRLGRRHRLLDDRHAHVLPVLLQIERGDLVQQHVVHVAEAFHVAFEHFDLRQLAAEADGLGAGLFEAGLKNLLFLPRSVQLLPDHLQQPRPQLALVEFGHALVDALLRGGQELLGHADPFDQRDDLGMIGAEILLNGLQLGAVGQQALLEVGLGIGCRGRRGRDC